jgi:L-iditol 2-dehydrogenase
MTDMQRAAIVGPEAAEIRSVPIPEPRPGWALVKIHAAPMCTEYKGWREGLVAEGIGHEAAGEVVSATGCRLVSVGDRVVVHPLWACGRCDLCLNGDYIYCEHQLLDEGDPADATMAQFILKPEWLLTPFPDDMTFDQASLACCALGPTFGAMERLNVRPSDVVLITGMGPVGLGGVVNARHRGARVVAVESAPWRQTKAAELGADLVLDPNDPEIEARIVSFAGGRGVDVAVDCSGAPQAHRLAIDAVRRRGAVAWVGESATDTPLQASRDMIEKGLVVLGNWHYHRSLYPKVLDVIRRSPHAGGLISHTFPLGEVQDAFATIASQQTAKVILRPWS